MAQIACTPIPENDVIIKIPILYQYNFFLENYVEKKKKKFRKPCWEWKMFGKEGLKILAWMEILSKEKQTEVFKMTNKLNKKRNKNNTIKTLCVDEVVENYTAE